MEIRFLLSVVAYSSLQPPQPVLWGRSERSRLLLTHTLTNKILIRMDSPSQPSPGHGVWVGGRTVAAQVGHSSDLNAASTDVSAKDII